MSQELTEIEQFEEYGKLHLTPEEVAEIFQLDKNEFIKNYVNNKTEQAKAYRLGLLKGKAQLRTVIMRQALQGSSPAQKEMVDFITATERKNEMLIKKGRR